MNENDITMYLEQNPWFIKPYEELKCLAHKDRITLNPGLDDAGIDSISEFVRSTFARVPGTYISFLKLINGLTAYCPHGMVRMYDSEEFIKKNRDRPDDPDPDYKRAGMLPGGFVHYNRQTFLQASVIGECSHKIGFENWKSGSATLSGTYFYYCPWDSYHLRLGDGGDIRFADCIHMLCHIAGQIRGDW